MFHNYQATGISGKTREVAYNYSEKPKNDRFIQMQSCETFSSETLLIDILTLNLIFFINI